MPTPTTLPPYMQRLYAGREISLTVLKLKCVQQVPHAARPRPISCDDWKRIQSTLMRAGGLRAVYRFDPALIDMNRSVRWWAIQAKAEAPRCPD